MIDYKLFQMKELAQRAIDEDLTDEEIQEIDKQVRDEGEQLKLLKLLSCPRQNLDKVDNKDPFRIFF